MVSRKILWALVSLVFLCSFRVIPHGNKWNINNSSTTASKIFIVYPNPTLTVPNDIESGDVLAGSSTLTYKQMMDSIINDYNNIQGAFLVLADSNDSDYAANSTGRTITIENGSALGASSGGYAKQTRNGTQVTGCTIVLKDQMFEKASYFVKSVTHELGHCFGLNHPMDTVNAVMSYYSDWNKPRLQIDDKMGLVYLYPVDETKSKEEVTLGLACSRK